MNPLIKKNIGALVRMLIAITAVKVDLSDDQLETVIEATSIVGVIVWSLYQKFRSQKETNTALALPRASTFVEVQQAIAATGGAPAMVAADEPPSISKVRL